MDINLVNPRRSCSNGGRKIYLVFDSPISHDDVEPYFQIFTQNGHRLVDKEHLLLQPGKTGDFLVLFETIIFEAPAQAHLDEISSNGWTIKVTARRRNGEESTNNFEFSYQKHSDIFPCKFCDVDCLDGTHSLPFYSRMRDAAH